MTGQTGSCPRCCKPLVPGTYEGVDVDLCQSCGGMIVSRRRMIPLMEKLCTALIESVDPDREIEPTPAGPAGIPCPACGRPMAQNPYMGSQLVKVDGCDGCDALWLDPAALGVMTLLWARTERRMSTRRAELERQEAADLVRSTVLARRVQRSLLGSFVTRLMP